MSEKIIQIRGIFNYKNVIEVQKIEKYYVCFYILTQIYAFDVEHSMFKPGLFNVLIVI